jgi:hypothetical protein
MTETGDGFGCKPVARRQKWLKAAAGQRRWPAELGGPNNDVG